MSFESSQKDGYMENYFMIKNIFSNSSGEEVALKMLLEHGVMIKIYFL